MQVHQVHGLAFAPSAPPSGTECRRTNANGKKRFSRLSKQTPAALLSALAGATYAPQGRAEPLRLRADALVQAESTTQTPAGLLVLQGRDSATPWMDAEALVWGGVVPDATADVLVLALHLREPHGYGELRAGRFILATGAVGPIQMDGAEATGRTRWGLTAETFGGIPVVPRFGPRPYDWLAGGRIAQTVVSSATLGVSYVQRRDDGDVASEEVGGDLALYPVRWLDVAARGAYDLVWRGLAEALLSAAVRAGDFRIELFASQRSPARLLPATSLFSVLGDFSSEMAGSTVRWRAAPRLDLLASGAAQSVGDELGGNGWVRATLRLDDRGAASLGFEVRRQDVSTAQWSGVRAVASAPIGRFLRYSWEIEVVAPDHPDGRGVLWPWGLLSLSWRSRSEWEVAAAVEASSTPQYRYDTNALLRLSRTLDVR